MKRVRPGLRADGGLSNPLPYDLLFSTFEIMQQSIIAARMQSVRPDIYVRPDTNDVRLLQFNRIHTILEHAGPAAAELRQQFEAALATP